MVSLYRQIVEAELDVADPVTAAIVKTAENAYRDVQIAFANEVALICEAAGADVWRVRELVNKSPARNMHLPGAGVGGHCIPKDGWLLARGARGSVNPRLIAAARAVNEGMPLHMMTLVENALAEHDLGLAGATVALLGYSYLEDSGDARHSPTAALAAALERRGATVRIHDPWVAEYRRPLAEVAQGCDAAILMVRHKAYLALELPALCGWLRTPILVDGRHVFSRETARAAGLTFRAVGVGRSSWPRTST
jgi:UDP-N-acetyl-D-mannosaminuronic acid dehydrogenase